jgi:hypothetical protein
LPTWRGGFIVWCGVTLWHKGGVSAALLRRPARKGDCHDSWRSLEAGSEINVVVCRFMTRLEGQALCGRDRQRLLTALRGPSESYRDVIVRLVEAG